MIANEDTAVPATGRRWLIALGVVFAVFVAAGFGSLQYSGLISEMGEWQFRRLGFYLPVLSIFAWLALAAVLLALVGKVIGRRSATEEPAPADAATLDPRRASLLVRNVLLAVGFVAGLVALGGAINLLFMPSTKGAERVVTPGALGPKVEGNARLQGFRVAGPMARYSDGVLFWKQDIFLVPLAAAASDEQGSVPVFAQVTKYEAASKVPAAHRGVLRQGALPRELYPLYAAQGVAVQDNAAVLYRDSYSMALPTLLLVGEGAAVALIAFGTALLIHRRRPRKSALT